METVATNEELAALIQAGDRALLLDLWGQCRRLIWRYARRWEATARRSGAEIEDLMQAGFCAMLRAVDDFDVTRETKFTTILDYYLKGEFTVTCGLRTERNRRDPLLHASSLDAPLSDSEDETLTLVDTLPDPTAEAAISDVMERDQRDRLRTVLEDALAQLPEDQRTAIRRRYYSGNQVPLSGPEKDLDAAAYKAALRALRHPSRSRLLMEYWR